MKQYAGLDVSLKEISIGVVDRDGEVIARGSTIADPEAIVDFFAGKNISPESIVHESGPLSIWLQRGLERLGQPAICIDARKAHKALSAHLNKSHDCSKQMAAGPGVPGSVGRCRRKGSCFGNNSRCFHRDPRNPMHSGRDSGQRTALRHPQKHPGSAIDDHPWHWAHCWAQLHRPRG